jgi:hypothetical protein
VVEKKVQRVVKAIPLAAQHSLCVLEAKQKRKATKLLSGKRKNNHLHY